MRRLVLAVLLAMAAGPSYAQSDEIEGVIGSQIEAFRADDFTTAFTFASPDIRDLFGTPENFGRMVRQGYPMVWRPDSVHYGELREIGGRLWQRVIVRDADGAIHALDYEMEQGPDGWRIDGVQVLRAPQVGA